jgi:hypothetical protein
MEPPRCPLFQRPESAEHTICLKDVIDKNRTLLTRNIILTEDFYNLLRQEKILSETMIKDVQVKLTIHKSPASRNTPLWAFIGVPHIACRYYPTSLIG